MRWRHAATVLTTDGREAMMCVDMEESSVRAARPDLDVRAWAEFGGSAMTTLAQLLGDLGVAGGRVAVEMSYLSAKDHEELRDLLPQASLSAGDLILQQSRRLKTEREVALLGELSRLADRAIADGCRAVSAGATEMDIAAALTAALFRQGAQQFKLMIVASGERSQLPNVGPTHRVLRQGDICRIEIFPVIDGYHAGVCRTAVVGEAGPTAQSTYRKLAECKQLVLETMAPGVRASDVYEVFRARFDELGMPAIAFVGHGIGLDLHEPPYLASSDDSTLMPGMVMGVEPLVYRSGHGFGLQIKDMVAVDEAGARLLSDVTCTDELLVIE
jgi:Xaa-Pro aminopeptidase